VVYQAYPIYIGSQLFANSEALGKILLPHLAGHQVMIVTQENIAAHYLPILQHILQAYECHVVTVPAGEQHKGINAWLDILNALVLHAHERSTTLIALGGGMVGDMTGFAAACYLRGVRYIQIPTTLVAQVDAAIGGKTAVNHPSGKNMIGAFYHPHCVISDIAVLNTLPEREYRAGLAEVIKYGLIRDAAFFQWLEENMLKLLRREEAALLYAVCACSRIKTEIVFVDDNDEGLRNILNFGHTFGHALEVANVYQGVLHGEAVAQGMYLATLLSADLGWLAMDAVSRVKDLLIEVGLLDISIHFPSPVEFIALMRRDKKVRESRLHFILLQSIGCAVMTNEVTEEQLIAVITKVSP
jgi:3-dehydroquinate synthase